VKQGLLFLLKLSDPPNRCSFAWLPRDADEVAQWLPSGDKRPEDQVFYLLCAGHVVKAFPKQPNRAGAEAVIDRAERRYAEFQRMLENA
jgi:hypothetical protein